MFGRLMPREGRFFDNFVAISECVLQGSRELQDLLVSFDDLERRVYRIESIEKEGDKITHATVELLHKTFITPIDRDDVHQLITKLDDILDLIEDAAQTVQLYDIRSVTPEAVALAELCVKCVERTKAAVEMLHSMKNAKAILDVCKEIDRLESDADRVYRKAMAQLFRDEPDVRQVMKLRAVYDLLEEITDRCDQVANILEGIVLENA
ncbi:MAG: DUF47 domain-containing protein [Candidatus Methylophosphatis roskildensis]|jgi:predicted phosphate transport protein (TIGR00153 family)|uniref:DUF47 domain-containing protein n=1 Tax=Candidatus Methylophosphatis roskildensis TaxID=2899263 RepID=A0A9D7E7S1_9PROT|nr:DUF47 domain-containing protein [Candidatus Methylophosphatis roskildensis]MBK7235338.1 DUF47 domain-containing protein [Sterolibacteriaceae bacterium]MBK7663542.1 DUF47 domain-containing protein [Sterolibacteriaceae bacterium]MBK9083881.1 DUF47 domain-containing protein [Sterolibacteriaceae bacterium]